MLHQPLSHFDQQSVPSPLDDDRPTFDASAYIAAMGAADAQLEPVRGALGQGLRNGSFTVALPPDAAARRRIAAIEAKFAATRALDPSAEGRVAYCLLEEASKARFAAAVDGDFEVAKRELVRLKHRQDVCAALEDDPDADERERAEATEAADVATMDYFMGVEHVLAMPIRQTSDIALKARCAVLHCSWGDELQRVLAEIARSAGLPDDALVPPKLMG